MSTVKGNLNIKVMRASPRQTRAVQLDDGIKVCKLWLRQAINL